MLLGLSLLAILLIIVVWSCMALSGRHDDYDDRRRGP